MNEKKSICHSAITMISAVLRLPTIHWKTESSVCPVKLKGGALWPALPWKSKIACILLMELSNNRELCMKPYDYGYCCDDDVFLCATHSHPDIPLEMWTK